MSQQAGDDLPTQLALQVLRVQAVHQDDPDFVYNISENCSHLTAEVQKAALFVHPDEHSLPHMDRQQVLRDMMPILNMLYDQVPDEQQIFITWISDAVAEKFYALEQAEDLQLLGPIAAHWFSSVAGHFDDVPTQEYADFAEDLEGLVSFRALGLEQPLDLQQDTRNLTAPELAKTLVDFKKVLQNNVTFLHESNQETIRSAVDLISQFVAEVSKKSAKPRHKRESQSAANPVFVRIARGPGTEAEGFQFPRSHSGRDVLPPAKVKTNDLGRSLLNFLSGTADAADGANGTDDDAKEHADGGATSVPATAAKSSATANGTKGNRNDSRNGGSSSSSSSNDNSHLSRPMKTALSFIDAESAIRRQVSTQLPADSRVASGVENLDLSGWNVSGRSFETIVSQAAPTVRRLELYCSQIDGDVVDICCRQPMPNMQSFSLCGVNSGEGPASNRGFDVARVVRQCRAMPHLQELDLRWNRLTQQQVMTIVQALQDHTALKRIDFAFNAVSRTALADLKKRLPNLPFTYV